jgi:ankyrin repeat protein
LYQYGGFPVAGILPLALRQPPPQNLEIVNFLLGIGAPIDGIEHEHDPSLAWLYQDMNDGPAINLAVQLYSDEMVELLLLRGARTDIKDSYGQTCLDLARNLGFSSKEELILSHEQRRKCLMDEPTAIQ